MNYEILLAFILASAALAISPGPDNMYVLVQSIVHGRKFGIATALGLVAGCIVHTTLLAFGVSAVIKENELVFLVIKIFGAIYLFYLAYKVYKSPSDISFSKSAVPFKNTWQLFQQGFIMNVLNPKVTIFFLAFFPGFLFSENLNTVIQLYVLGLLFMLVALLIFVSIAIMAGAISDYVKSNKNIGVFLKWLQILAFIGIAIYLLFSST